MADSTTWLARAAEAETALHKLMTGGRAVEVTGPDGMRVTYQEADAEKLRSYVSYCEQRASDKRRPIYPLL